MVRGPYKNRKHLLSAAIGLRNKGYGYGYIGKRLGVGLHTIRHWVCHIKVNRGWAVKLGLAKVVTINLKSKGALRKRLIEERGHRCECCGLAAWLQKPITLELHQHVNAEMAKLLCPNCHSQTADWRRKK